MRAEEIGKAKAYRGLTRINADQNRIGLSEDRRREGKNLNHKGHPYDSSFASSESLRAGYGTRREKGRVE